MGVVFALLAMEVRAIIITAAVLGTKTLLWSPGFDQGSVHREMLVRKQRLACGWFRSLVLAKLDYVHSHRWRNGPRECRSMSRRCWKMQGRFFVPVMAGSPDLKEALTEAILAGLIR
jgi:hypothetical protein